MNFVVPVIVLVILNLLVFVLPPESGERVSFSITVLLSFIVFISGITEQLPETNNPLCLFNVYLVVQLIYSALISTSVIGVAWMFHRESDLKVPIALEYMFGKRKLCLRIFKRMQIGEDGRVTPDEICKQDEEKETKESNWQSIARRVDKIVYYFFAVFAVVETVTDFSDDTFSVIWDSDRISPREGWT
ncbi:hypothetical protein FSP39_002085 [Pinctada imbricata]|uniref:Neurotransmitter-gated ion-channel transmembrane domain-containing protein n=1 Tax=Pinctada imbricata TaxID=66713 RepID=A0AA88Y1L2_PINIB|nr:hypothetical protein FSP39_002085 [Pinctada imbricata]